MPLFAFISNEAFRASLESDYRELETCIDAGAWKAAHVLAGSIVEAVLLDYLLSTDFAARSKEDPLKFDLGRIISACRLEKIISERVQDLSSVIREYRNLIHPGKSVRTGETVDSESATIAKSLVVLISNEVTAKRSATYGLTAEQIVAKVISDPSNNVVMTYLLKTANAREIARLLLKIVPTEYRDLESGLDDSLPDVLRSCFRLAFQFANDETKRAVAAEFVRVLKNEAEPVIRSYETGLFVGSELKYLSPEEVALVKAHLLARMDQDLTIGLLGAAEGLEEHINADEVNDLIDPMIRAIAYGPSPMLRKECRKYLEQAFQRTPMENDGAWRTRLDQWVDHLKKQGRDDQAQLVSDLRSQTEDMEFPF